jgi:hypothetical protein
MGGIGGSIALVAAAIFVVRSLVLASRADACARELAERAAQKDSAYLERAVKTPSARDAILHAHKVELGFVRPASSQWTRVGLFVTSSSTSTRASALVLILESGPAGRCEFLRDYESGPFSGGHD